MPGDAMSETIAYARQLADELAAGHPQYQDVPEDELLGWQKQQINFWALNLQGVLARCVPALLSHIDALEVAVAGGDDPEATEAHDGP